MEGRGFVSRASLTGLDLVRMKGFELAMSMKEVSLEEWLDASNPWTARLLGEEAFARERNAAQVEQEYDQDFYGKRLRAYLADPAGFERTKLYADPSEIVASVGSRLFRMPYSGFVGIKRGAFLAILERFGVTGELCELGAGNGQNHVWLQASQSRPVYGGEYSKNAVELAEHLGFEISRFDFYEPDDYAIIRPGSTVFTFHAIEQIPDARCIIAGLKSRRQKIARVIHLEPLYRAGRDDALGRLRNRYAEINDYNRNLLACLQDDPDILIEHLEEDAFGNNPLNPASIVVWRFR